MNSFKNKTVFITGAHGFIGYHLTKKLIELGAKVHVAKRRESNNWRLNLIQEKIFSHNVDFNNKNQLLRFLKNIQPNYIYNLSSYGGHNKEIETETIINTNLTQNINLLSALKETKFDFLVNTGSSSEYGFKTKPMKETDLLEPNSFYAATKAATTLLCQVYTKIDHLPIATIRPFSVYGPLDSKSKLIPTAIVSCLKGETLKLTGGKEKHDYIYIEDLIDAFIKVPFSKKANGEIINIGTGKQYSNEEIVSRISKIADNKIKVIKGAYPKHSWDTKYWKADIKKAKKIIDWKPKHSIDKGLGKTIDWFSDNLEYYAD